MREITFDESKKIMVEILSSIDKCCRENNINYSLCWGTLIGAIRHHGFIPWDDDIDVMMSRADYDRFLSLYNDSRYEIFTPTKNKNFIQILSKISDKRTEVYFDNYSHKSLFGLWVSIFPYDNAPDKGLKAWEFKRNILMNLYHIKTVRFLSTDNLFRKFVKCSLKLITLPFSSFALERSIRKCLTQFNNSRTKMISIWPADYFTVFKYFPSELFDEYEEVPFENIRCKIIKGYDQFLKIEYGDYMSFPPVEDQVPKHDYKAYFVCE